VSGNIPPQALTKIFSGQSLPFHERTPFETTKSFPLDWRNTRYTS